jgi:ABC-type transport system involved in multi-copper enzyme maturation permease subunit
MGDLIGAEWRKIWTGRSWWALGTAALLLSALADAGYLKQALDKPAQARPSAAELTSTLVQGWFTVELAAALVGMLAVTREFGSGAICRSVLLSGGRGRLLLAKLLAVAGTGALFAVVTGAVAAVSPWVFLTGHYRPQWTATTTWTLLGVMLVVVTGALWGSLLGLLIRQQVAAVVTLLLSTWLVSEGLLRLAPKVGRFTIDEAMASVYRSGNAGLLSIPWALVVLALWIAAAIVGARVLFLRRDLP